MASSSVDQATRQRVLAGLELFEEQGRAIEPLGKGRYSVPSRSRSGLFHEADLGLVSGEPGCSCEDHGFHPEYTCLHQVAAELFRTKVQRPRWKRQQREFRERHGRPQLEAEAVVA